MPMDQTALSEKLQDILHLAQPDDPESISRLAVLLERSKAGPVGDVLNAACERAFPDDAAVQAARKALEDRNEKTPHDPVLETYRKAVVDRILGGTIGWSIRLFSDQRPRSVSAEDAAGLLVKVLNVRMREPEKDTSSAVQDAVKPVVPPMQAERVKPSADVARAPSAMPVREGFWEAALFDARPSEGLPPGLFAIPACLPGPPPAHVGPDALLKWFEGVPWTPGSPGIACHALKTASEHDLTEIEAEIHASPGAALKTLRAMRPVPVDEGDTHWLGRAGRNLGAFSVTWQNAAQILADHLSAVMGRSEISAPLRYHGATLKIEDALADAVAATIEVERSYLADTPDSEGLPDQDHSRAISPAGRLDEPVCMQRAVHLFLAEQVCLPSAMRQSLFELRQAQILQRHPDADLVAFHSAYENDPVLYFDELEDAVVDRSAMEAPAPA